MGSSVLVDQDFLSVRSNTVSQDHFLGFIFLSLLAVVRVHEQEAEYNTNAQKKQAAGFHNKHLPG